MAEPAAAQAELAPSAVQRVPPGAVFAVAVLTAMNLLNYLDRYVPSAVKDLFKKDLQLTDAQTSYPLTAFVLVYMLTSPLFGSLSDRWPRKVLIAAGVALWSLATGAAALATGFWTFLLARAMVGVGEAAYATLSPPLLSDFYPPDKRNRILTFFYVAIPVGSALGFILGGQLGTALGWRWAFLIAGIPGLLAAALVLWVKDPGRGNFDADAQETSLGWPQALRTLAKNRPYLVAVAGYTAVTFASGALADWFPTFLARHRAMGLDDAGMLVGTSAVVGGLGGTLAGGLLADRLRGVTRQPYFALCALATAGATFFAVLALRAESAIGVTVSIYLAQFFLWFYNGPINTLLVNSVSSAMRVRAFSLSILLIHLLGDALSPAMVGVLSDRSGLPLAINLVPVAMGLGALLWGLGWRALPENPSAISHPPASRE